jgi:thiamine pyrophosphokinase
MPKKIFILADGAPMPRALLARLRRGRFTVALDGAAEQARRERWRPDLLLGDFDTVSPSTLAYFSRRGSRVLPAPDQNHTDLEKALFHCFREGASNIWIAQGLGARLDHSLANLSFLKRFHRPGRELLLFSKREQVRFVRDSTLRLKGRKGRGFALLPFPRCVARSKGLAYEMRGLKLELGKNESVSNRAEMAVVELSVRGEALVIEELIEGI